MKEDVLGSAPLFNAFLRIVNGDDYSRSLARSLNISQPSALELLQKLDKKKLIAHLELAGRILRYEPKWHNVAVMWADSACERTLKYIDWNSGQIHKDAAIEENVVQEKFERLKKDEGFTTFVEIYFQVLAEIGYKGTFAESFILFSNEVLPALLMTRCLRHKKAPWANEVYQKLPFIRVLEPDNRGLPTRVANLIAVKLQNTKMPKSLYMLPVQPSKYYGEGVD